MSEALAPRKPLRAGTALVVCAMLSACTSPDDRGGKPAATAALRPQVACADLAGLP